MSPFKLELALASKAVWVMLVPHLTDGTFAPHATNAIGEYFAFAPHLAHPACSLESDVIGEVADVLVIGAVVEESRAFRRDRG